MVFQGNISSTDSLKGLQNKTSVEAPRRYYQGLTGVRGFAVLLVLLSHSSHSGFLIHPGLNFAGAGRYGVFLFFVLSAFLLTSQFVNQTSTTAISGRMVQEYFFRRFLRIYPLFTSALLVYLAVGMVWSPLYIHEPADVWRSLLLLDGPGIFWTIPVEFQFYFLIPALGWLGYKLRQHAGLLILALALVAIAWGKLFPPSYTANLLPFLPIFLSGSIAAIFVSQLSKTNERSKRPLVSSKLVCASAWISLGLFVLFVPGIYNLLFQTQLEFDHFHKNFLLFALLGSALVVCVVGSNGHVTRLMRTRFMVFWGKVSFSAYLWHMLLLRFLESESSFGPSMNLIIFLSLIAVLSYFSYVTIERPLSRIRMPQARLMG